MRLQERLDELKAKARQRIPAETWAVMERVTSTLAASGITDKVVKVGEVAPDFTLPTRAGTAVALAGLVARGPVVLSFYRGRW
ncbi:MAG: hypothetical protein ACREJG_12380 [Candidatus Rokuibacteriota bacterium]